MSGAELWGYWGCLVACVEMLRGAWLWEVSSVEIFDLECEYGSCQCVDCIGNHLSG